MKTFLPFLFALIFSLSLNSQITEANKALGGNFLFDITAIPSNWGYLAFGAEGTLQLIDRMGNTAWEYDVLQSLNPYISMSNPKYFMLPDGRIFGSFSKWECDFCLGTNIFMLDLQGNELWTKELDDTFRNGCFYGTFSSLNDDGNIVSYGKDSILTIDLDGNILSRTHLFIPADGGTSYIVQWNQGEQVYRSFRDTIYSINENGEVLGKLPIGTTKLSGLALGDSMSFVVLKNRVKMMRDFEFVGSDYVTTMDIQHAFIKNDRLYLAGREGNENMVGSLDLKLQDPQFMSWGNRFLSVTGFSGIDSILFISGYEQAGPYHTTPFIKTISDNFFLQPLKFDAEVVSVSADSAFGSVKTFFPNPMDSTTTYDNAVWTIKNLQAVVRNNGTDLIKGFTLNTERSVRIGCSEFPTVSSKEFIFDLPPGKDTTIVWGDKNEMGLFPNMDLPDEVDFCFWVSSPNERLDVDNTNDLQCETITIRDVTSVKSPFQSDALTLYPNPTSGMLNLEIDDPSFRVGEIQIFDPFGKLVFAQPFQPSVSNSLDVSELSPGVYVLHLKFSERQMVKKFIKK